VEKKLEFDQSKPFALALISKQHQNTLKKFRWSFETLQAQNPKKITKYNKKVDKPFAPANALHNSTLETLIHN
jgi:hypothetical protein